MEGAIRRPDAPDHLMVLKPINRRVIVRSADGTLLAESTSAIRMLEAGKTLYDPVVYLPAEDVKASLIKQDKSTHCPLKGDASYFSILSEGGGEEDIAWSYEEPLDFSQAIKGFVAFYPDRVIMEEHPF